MEQDREDHDHPTGSTNGAVPTESSAERTIDYWIDKEGTTRCATSTLASGSDVTITVTASPDVTLHNPFTEASATQTAR